MFDKRKTKRMLYHFKNESCKVEQIIKPEEMLTHTQEQPVMFGKINDYGNEKLEVNL